MPISSRIRGPSSVELGKTGTGRISVICWGSGSQPTTLKYGIGYERPRTSAKGSKSVWYGWKNYTKSVPCNQPFEFTFDVTQEMLDKQKAGYALFVYSCDGMADRPIQGVGKGRYSFFAATKPGVAPIGGRTLVATRLGTRRSRRGKLIRELYADRYDNGTLKKRSDDYGGAYARPDGKVFREGFAGFWSYVRFIRGSLFNTLAQDERDWLIARGVTPVPADWTPVEGKPTPTYKLTGAFTSFPSAIPISAVPGWGVKLAAGTLPVTFDLQGLSCTDVFGRDVTPPNIAGQIPVMFSVNGVTIATLTPASKVTLDLAQLFSLWATTITMDVKEISLVAQTVPTTIGGVSVPGIVASRTISVTEGPEPTAGEKRSPTPCWDGTTAYAEVYDATLKQWILTGEVCPAVPTAGERRSPTSCWDGSIIYAEKFDTVTKTWVPTGESCPTEPAAGERRSPSPCWDGSTIYAEKYDTTLHRWIPSGESCPAMPVAGSKRSPKTCWDGSIIHAEKFDAASKTWIPTGEVCPAEPPAGAKRASETCWDGTVIYGEVFREGRWVATGAKCPAMPAAGEKRSPTPCWDGSVIHTEIFSGGAWIPSGEACPPKLVKHTLEVAVPKIAYEGQPVTIVGQAFCGAAASHDEDANLVIDGATIETKKTKSGEVSFRWTAKGVGMHKVCVNIPGSPSCQVPITECETMMVSAYVAGIAEQIKREKAAYEERLTELKKRKKIAAGKVSRPGVPGYVRVPASLAGSVINVGGVKVTVPPGGTTVQVPSGDSIVSVIREGISTNVPVLVSPGEVINLPTGGLPELPGLPGGI